MTIIDPPSNGSHIDPYTTPAISPPSGVTPNFVDAPAPLRTWFIAVTAICCTLTSVFTIARIYTKVAILKEFLIEDISLVLAWVGSCVWFGLNYTLPVAGRHAWNVTVADAIKYGYIINIVLILFSPLSFLAKFSILKQMKRLFTKDRNVLWWLIEISIWLNLVFYLALMFLSIFQCWPRAKIGNPLVEGTCLPFAVLVVPPTVVTLLSDMWMTALPILIVWKLQIALQRKFAVSAAFVVGLLSVFAAGMMLYFSAEFAQSRDMTYKVYPIVLTAGLQLACLIIAAAIPTMPAMCLALRGISMQENEPSPLGRIPLRERPSAYKDLERSESALSLNRTDGTDAPCEIFTRTEVRVTSMHFERDGLK